MNNLFNSAFYQFVLALVGMVCLVTVRVLGVTDTAVIDNVLSGVIGAGVWGGLRAGATTQHAADNQPPGNPPGTP